MEMTVGLFGIILVSTEVVGMAIILLVIGREH